MYAFIVDFISNVTMFVPERSCMIHHYQWQYGTRTKTNWEILTIKPILFFFTCVGIFKFC